MTQNYWISRCTMTLVVRFVGSVGRTGVGAHISRADRLVCLLEFCIALVDGVYGLPGRFHFWSLLFRKGHCLSFTEVVVTI